MAKKNDRTSTAITKVEGVNALLLDAQGDDSLDRLGEYVIVPFVKVIQGMSNQELKDKFGEGFAILQPGESLISERTKGGSTKFCVVPLFFFTQFRKWADRNDSSNMIVDTSYDPESELAKRSRDPERWNEVYEEDVDKDPKDQKVYRYVEHLCFVCVIYGDHPLEGTRCMISFQKGDFRTGRGFASGISQRKSEVEKDGVKTRVKVPLWAQIWEFSISQRDRNNNKWWGFDPSAPPEDVGPIISPEEFPIFEGAYKELKEAHAANMLRIDGDDSGVNEATTPADSKDF